MENIKPIIDEYPLDYCFMLEDTYGRGLMSEGGSEAIDKLFDGIELKNKKVLDLGSGLGGLAFYLSEKYDCEVLGLEINEAMVREAVKRIPNRLSGKVDFKVYSDLSKIPFEENSFDVVCSKGVLVHVNDKKTLFKELSRVLRQAGVLVINDWLCSDSRIWGQSILNMCELKNLTLYPVKQEDYKKILSDVGFTIEVVRDCSKVYSQYNRDLVRFLIKHEKDFLKKYDRKDWEESIQGYNLISKSQEEKELLVIEFIAQRTK